LFGGRWNHKSVQCIYTSETRALGLLEYTVNINIDEIPRALSIVTFEIPDQEIEIVSQEKLPGNWKEIPAPASTKDFGTNLLKTSAKGVFKIPSSVMPFEFNYLLNPLHPSAKNFKLIEIIDFVYDVRIKLV
jgi:RES domain-containing protein